MLPLRTGIRLLLLGSLGSMALLGGGACAPEPLAPAPADPPGAWRLVNPRPFDANLTDVWGTAPDRMFAVGLYGALLVRDPSGWRQAPSFTASHIRDVHGCDRDHVWAVAEEGLFRFDGRRWRRDGPADLDPDARVWCNAPDDVMVVTGLGFAHHWDGHAWIRSNLDVYPAGAPGDWLAGAPDGRYLAVGRQGRCAFWERGAWRIETYEGEGTLQGALFLDDEHGGTWAAAVEEYGPQAVRIVLRDAGHWVEHNRYDGGLFVGMAPGEALYRPYVLTSLWNVARVDVRGGRLDRISVLGFSTAALATFPGGSHLEGDSLVLVGPYGTILAGDSASGVLTPTTASIPFSAIGCTVWPNGDFAAFDDNSILHGRDGTLRLEPVPVLDRLTAVWGPSPGTLYAVGTEGLILLVRDGEPPRLIALGEAHHYYAVWGSGPDDVWIGGAVTVHWDGATWTTVPWPLRGNVLRIRGYGPDDVYASSDLDLARWDGEAWTSVGPADATGYFGLDVAPDTGDVYVIARPSGSETRELMRRRGGVWEDCGAPGDNAGAIVALPHETAYVATYGQLRHWQAGVWNDVPYPVVAPDGKPWGVIGGDAQGGIYAGFNTGGFYHLDWEER